MSLMIKNDDFVLREKIYEDYVISKINKYSLFLESLCGGEYIFQKDLIDETLKFILSNRYKNIIDLANENYDINEKIKSYFPNKNIYLDKFPIKNKKSCTIDSATGTGKSYVLYGLSIIMICEGLVDKVLVLCPSLTIEEELTNKFTALNSNNELHNILKEINVNYRTPEIVNANETVLNNQICIENIDATYDRTGSSIEDSFKGVGKRVLVLNDEAHHIFSAKNNKKKWLEFLLDEKYDFKYIINLTGTPYYIGSDEYFYDVIARFSLKDATDKNIVKKIDYKIEEDYKDNKEFKDSYIVHEENKKIYGEYIKPISIIVTEKIITAIEVSVKLVKFIANTENISEEEAARKVIWVSSSLPTNKNENKLARELLDNPDEIRKENLKLLKSVDDYNNPVEWIVSVSMLTEGWDVKNVFQIVPHERRAFNSKLLISQVLGRGLRIPQLLKDNNIDCYVKVNNHESWTKEIKKMYEDILEVQNRLDYGFFECRKNYNFDLYNIEYKPIENIEVNNIKTSPKEKFGFITQSKKINTTDKYNSGDIFKYIIEQKEIYSIENAVTLLYAYLKQKDSNIIKTWDKKKIKDSIILELSENGQEIDFLSKENYIRAQIFFDSLLANPKNKVSRISLKEDNLKKINISQMQKQSFSEDSLKSIGAIFYTSDTNEYYIGEQKELFNNYISVKEILADLYKTVSVKTSKGENIEEEKVEIQRLEDIKKLLEDHVICIDKEKFKSPMNLIYVSHKPEISFVKSIFNNIDLISLFIKSPDKGFYSFPYSYKPKSKSEVHVHYKYFNPDFFIKINSDIIVVEIKTDGDDSEKNKAKLKCGLKHFEIVNKRLEENGLEDRYYFKFLSPENNDYVHFWESIRRGNYKKWCSTLMQMLKV